MKNLLLISLCILMNSCNYINNQQQVEEITLPSKFKDGELVYVGQNAFIVQDQGNKNKKYYLKQLDCRSSNCFYFVLESEITKYNIK